MVLDGGFANNRQLYFCFAEKGEGGDGADLARAGLNTELTSLEGAQVIFRQVPKMSGQLH